MYPLETCLAEAEAEVWALKAELDSDPAASRERVDAARRRAAQDREARIQAALKVMREIEQQKTQRRKKGPDDAPPEQRRVSEKPDAARVSSTDPEARMRMADGGFRPAYNAQLATDTASQVITGVDLINIGSDLNPLEPMAEQLDVRHGRRPTEWLADAGFVKHEQIDALADRGITAYAPVH